MNERSNDNSPMRPWARYSFICVLIIAFVVIYAASSHVYFYSDEWTLFQQRPLTSFRSWVDPHNSMHWIPGLVALYGILFNLVGIDHYWFYHLPGVVMHLLAAWMLREVMVSAHVDQWTATACATLFVFYGVGAQNIVWAFQVGFTASLSMGLVQLACATHPVPTRRRDLTGLGAGMVSLAFGGVGVTMAIVVGLATMLLRGWRAAALHTAPLGLIYLLWWFNFGRGAVAQHQYGTPTLWAQWEWEGFAEVFGTLVGWAPLGLLLVTVTIVGLWMRVRDQLSTADGWRPLVPVLALACGAVVFQLITALGRVAQPLGLFIVMGPDGARSSRYVYIVAALMLPLIGIAVSYVIHRWRIAAVPLVIVFVIGLVSNVRHLVLIENAGEFDQQRHLRTRALVSDAAYSDLIELVPADTVLRLPYAAVATGWLRTIKGQGRLPEVGGVTPERAAEAEAQLATKAVIANNVECHELIESGKMLDFVAGDIIRVTGKSLDAKFSYVYEREDGTRAAEVGPSIAWFGALRVVAPHAKLMILVNDKVEKIERCTSSATALR